jgi:hypothetical protein
MATPDDGPAGRRALIGPAIEHDVAMPVRILMRGYFSTYFLWTAQHHAELAGQMEAAHVGRSRFSIEHRGYVLTSIVGSAARPDREHRRSAAVRAARGQRTAPAARGRTGGGR